LEGGRGVTETEEHDDGFIEARCGNKGCFPAVIRMDKDVVVSPSDIDLGKIFRGVELVEEWRNQWEGICVSDHFSIEGAIILTWTKFSIFLSNEEKSAGLRGFGRNNGSSGEMFFDKFLHGLLLRRCELISFNSF